MRKSMLVSLLAVGVTTGTSLAVSTLTALPETNAGVRNDGGASYHVQGLTDDGAYVIASKYNTTKAGNATAMIKVSDGSVTWVDAAGRVSGGRGIGMAPNGLAGAACAEQNVPTYPLGLSVNAGATGSVYLQNQNGLGDISQVANFNAMALDANTGNGWLVGQPTANAGSNKGMAWKVTGGVVPQKATVRTTNTAGRLGWNGVSVAGIAVGSDDNYALYADVAGANVATQIQPFAGGNAGGDALGVSNNATLSTGYATGYFPRSSGDALHAFRYTIGGGTAELLPAGGDDLAIAQQSNGFDVSDNGTVGGFSYKGKTAAGEQRLSYDATVWLPGQTNGQLLQDILAANGVGLGDFSSLERIISVTSDGLTFAGRGVLASDGSYRGFVATIPEPATMGLLALGGLALLRRRSR